jgi:C4-type Zn-finger protein
MRLSLSAALLLFVGNKVWAFAPVARRALVRSSSRGSIQTTVSLLKATIDKRGMMMYAHNIAEAKQCLAEIEGAVQTAREYLMYLDEVAQVVGEHVNERAGGDASQKAAKDYLANIQAASSSAEAYLAYLEGVAKMVREQLLRMESLTPQEQEEEKKARIILEDLEQTVKQAKDYLSYLKGVANTVQQFINNPTSPPPPFLANIMGGGSPSFPRPPPVPTPPSSFSTAAAARVGGGSGRGIKSSVNGASLPSVGSGVTEPPLAPAVSTVGEVLDRRKEFAQRKEKVPLGGTSNKSDLESLSSKTSVTEGQGSSQAGDLESLSVKKDNNGMTSSTGPDMSILSVLMGLVILGVLTLLSMYSLYPDQVKESLLGVLPLEEFFRAPVEKLESLPQIELESLPDIKSESLPKIVEQVTQPLAPQFSVPPPDSVPEAIIEEVPDFDDWSF